MHCSCPMNNARGTEKERERERGTEKEREREGEREREKSFLSKCILSDRIKNV